MTRLTKTRAAILAVIVGGILTLSDPLIVAYAGTQAALWLLLGACLVLLILMVCLVVWAANDLREVDTQYRTIDAGAMRRDITHLRSQVPDAPKLRNVAGRDLNLHATSGLADPLAHCPAGRRFTVVPRSAKRG